jgi:sRNA-binding protein
VTLDLSMMPMVVEELAKMPAAARRTFAAYEQRCQRLKIGIHHDLIAALNGEISAEQALHAYTANKVYRMRWVLGATPVHIAGERVGTERDASTKQKVKPPKQAPVPANAPSAEEKVSQPPVPGRIGLAELRRMAQARKQQQTACGLRVASRMHSNLHGFV